MPVIRTPRGKYKKYLNDPTLVVPKSTQYHCKIDPHKTEAGDDETTQDGM